jgi:hypothetical protein
MGFPSEKTHTLNRQRHLSDRSDVHYQNNSKQLGKNYDNDFDDYDGEDESGNESCNESHGTSQAAFHDALPRHAGPYVRGNLHG